MFKRFPIMDRYSAFFQWIFPFIQFKVKMDTLISVIKNKQFLRDECTRLFHGRGQAYPGYENINIDWYPPVLLVTLYEPRDQNWLAVLARRLEALCPDVQSIVVQLRQRGDAQWLVIHGALPETLTVREGGLAYSIRLGDSQNIGFFSDMACGRNWVRENACDRKILNLFSYSCSFSVAALAGGAAQVVNMDMSRGALALGRINHQLNGFDTRKCSFLCMELFRSFSKLKKLSPFDLIICDPPLAQGKSFQAQRDWPKLIRRFAELLSPAGLVLCCTSSPEFNRPELDRLFTEFAPQAQLVERLCDDENYPDIDPERGTNLSVYAYS